MPNVLMIVQARMGSKRLANKMLQTLHNLHIIDWVYRRISESNVTNTVFAIPEGEVDQKLAKHLNKKNNIKVFRGSESDVLGRFCGALNSIGGDYVVRVCGDNPFVSRKQIDNLIKFHLKGNYDYSYNHIPINNSYPNGLGAEIVDASTLLAINGLAKKKNQREHVFNYIWDNPSKFKIGTFDPLDKRLRRPDIKLDIDTLEDLNFFQSVDLHPNFSDFEILKNVSYKNEYS